MRTLIYRCGLCLLASLALCGQADAFGFGGFRGGGFRAGGFRTADASWGGGGGWARSSYDRNLSGPRGGSLSVSGSRGAAAGPFGGFAAGGQREVTATGPGGRSFTGGRSVGVARGPFGGFAAGGSRFGAAAGPGGAFAGGARWGTAGLRFPTDVGLGRYSALALGRGGPSTVLWSHSAMVDRAGLVRAGFFNYNAFGAGWYSANPLAWRPALWAVAGAAVRAAWIVPSWQTVALYCDLSSPPVYFDYGSTIVYQNNNVYVNGDDIGTATQYEQQATTLAEQGQAAKPPEKTKWQPLGVFALVQGEEKTSNNLFQLALDQNGTIRGNYYDALMGSTTPVFGSVDKKTQRAAWTIGVKKGTVFETGLYNLTKSETPVLVHFGKDKTQQWMLVRMEQPKEQN